MPESNGISLTFGEAKRSRGGYLVCLVRAVRDDVMLFADTVRLDVADSRRAFAEEVVNLAEGMTLSSGEIERELLVGLELALEAERAQQDEPVEDADGEKKSQATVLVEMASAATLFHTPELEAFALLTIGTSRQTWPIGSRDFRDYLSHRFYERVGKAPGSQAVADAQSTLRGKALFEGPQWPVYTRIAELGGHIYLDRGDDSWSAIEIGPGFWRLVADAPVRFRRSRGMLPLPVPVSGGSLDELKPFLNVMSDEDWILLLSWLVMTLHPRGPYPILLLAGEQGSCKSTMLRVLRRLIDPNQAPLRSKPKDERDLFIAARNGHVIPFDNFSSISDDLSDILCRLATGGAASTRQLFTDGDEFIFTATRPIAINGIEDLASRGDLADRAVPLLLPRIPKANRRPEREFWEAFDAAAPRILGALLDVAADALKREPSIRLASSPRMADFARWACAAAPSLGWTSKEFLDAYEVSRRDAADLPLQSSPVVPPLTVLVDECERWQGRAVELLDELRDRATDKALKDRRWPRDATRLSGMLRRLGPSLPTIGIDVTFDRSKSVRSIIVERVPVAAGYTDDPDLEDSGKTASSASPPSSGRDPYQVEDGPEGDADEHRYRHPDSDSVTRDTGDDAPGDADVDAESPTVTTPPEGGDADDALSGIFSKTDVLYIGDAAEGRAAVAQLLTAPVLGLDTETTGLDPRSARVRLVQVATGDGRVYVFDLFRLDAGLLAPLFDPTVGPVLVGHNLRFDLAFLAEAGLTVPNGTRLFDTMLVAHLLEDGANRFPAGHFTLAGVAERYLGVTLDKTLQTSDWAGPLSDEQIDYAARDAAILPRLHAVMSEQIGLHDLDRVTALEMRALPPLVWLEQTGAPFDTQGWQVLAEQATRRQVEVEQSLTQEAGTLGPTNMFGETASTVNWSSPAQVMKVLAARGHEVERVDEQVLVSLLDREPLARLLLDHREAVKKAGTYGIGFLQHVHPTTGRVHADWHQLGSRAGRMSCSKPNLQQVPRDRAYRACFRPADGRALVKADFSQIELRIAAEIAPDERLMAAYANGDDVHMLTAAEVLGRKNGAVTKEDRQAAKALNFGLLYGAGGPTLRATAKTSYGVELSEADSMTFRRRFFDLYAGLRRWHRRQPGDEQPVDTRTLAGRRRLGVTRFTEKLNSPVQGSGADGLKAALALLWETRDQCPSAVPVLVVHDEIVLECDVADVEQAQQWLTDCMTRGMASFLTRVPVVVEATIERDWSGTPLSPVSEQEVA